MSSSVENSNINAPFLSLIAEATRLNGFKENPSSIYPALSEIKKGDFKYIKERINSELGNSQLRRLRVEIMDVLSSSRKMNEKTLNDMIQRIVNGVKKVKEITSVDILTLDEFAIFFPFLHHEQNFRIKNYLKDVADQIISVTGIQEFVAEPIIIDFLATDSLGTDQVQLRIYNKAHDVSQLSMQFVLSIDKDGVSCDVYDAFNNDFVQSEHITESQDILQAILDFFLMNVEFISGDFEKRTTEIRTLGVQGKNIYKISHGVDFFPTQAEIQYCIKNSLVVMNENTKAKGQSNKTQYQVFREAQEGDFFYLCWGNKECLLIGQFIDNEIQDYTRKTEPGWKQRKYKFLFQRTTQDSYRKQKKWWTPNDSSTCIQIPTDEIEMANNLLFRDFYQVEFKQDHFTALDPAKEESTSRIPITIDESLDAELEVKTIAKELAGIIDNLGDNKGQMLGIFGSWGRGKTFLYEQLADLIDTSDTKFTYTHHIFNAWKYQETEAIWAHLYGSLLEKYLEKRSYLGKQWKIFNLNIKRKGRWPFAKVILALLFSIATFRFSFLEFISKEPDQILAWLSGLTGVGAFGFMSKLYKKHYKSVKEVLTEYTSINDYSSVLGLQAEIQKELLILIQHWLSQPNQRLLLFIDDLDRCSEKKIIQVIDALRVMLDDDELIKKIVVLVAVDEILLERAIQHKYQDFKIPDDSPKEVVKEYMDKLFIGGVKLPKLNEIEQGIILKAYAIKNNFLEKEEGVGKIISEPDDPTPNPDDSRNPQPQNTELDFTNIPIKRKVIISEFFLLEKELELLKTNATRLSINVTPRQLRIYMYRYLLAKNMAAEYLVNRKQSDQLSDAYCEFLSKAIAERSNLKKGSIDYSGELNLTQISNETLRDFTPKLIEIVVPY